MNGEKGNSDILEHLGTRLGSSAVTSVGNEIIFFSGFFLKSKINNIIMIAGHLNY